MIRAAERTRYFVQRVARFVRDRRRGKVGAVDQPQRIVQIRLVAGDQNRIFQVVHEIAQVLIALVAPRQRFFKNRVESFQVCAVDEISGWAMGFGNNSPRKR